MGALIFLGIFIGLPCLYVGLFFYERWCLDRIDKNLEDTDWGFS